MEVDNGTLEKLKLLGYSGEQKIIATEFAQLVVWIEEEKIRLYPTAKRAPLKDWRNRMWYQEALLKYITHLNFKSLADKYPKNTEEGRKAVLKLLAQLAIEDIYKDYEESGQIIFEKEETKKDEDIADQMEDVISETSAIAKALNLPPLPEDFTKRQLLSFLKCVHAYVSLSSTTAMTPGQQAPFTKPETEAERVIIGMEAIRQCELRDLQDELNSYLFKLQQVTADPRTDNRRGRVGM
eukprot:Trichotokara_eunicae@DN4885_c0_g1_i2.p1